MSAIQLSKGRLPSGGTVPDARATAFLAGARRTSLLAALCLTVLAVVGFLPGPVLAPLVVALLVGLPHGAVDHLTLMRRVTGARGVLLGTVGYAGGALATFLLMGRLPLPMWALFLVVSVWHFGTADREYLDLLGARPRLVFVLATGALPVGALMVRDPDGLRPVAAAIHPAVLRILEPDVVRATALVLVATVLLALVVELRAGNRVAAADLTLLAVVFLVVPPLWAFGVYFGLWHSLRHVSRMVATEDPWASRLRAAGGGAAVRRFALDAAAPTLIASTALVVLVLNLDRIDPAVLTAVALKVTAAVTFPHVMTVAFLDRRQAGTG